jgi:hypothetical protein
MFDRSVRVVVKMDVLTMMMMMIVGGGDDQAEGRGIRWQRVRRLADDDDDKR